jgi:hypothetical protein
MTQNSKSKIKELIEVLEEQNRCMFKTTEFLTNYFQSILDETEEKAREKYSLSAKKMADEHIKLIEEAGKNVKMITEAFTKYVLQKG